jgi:hypothetical protein
VLHPHSIGNENTRIAIREFYANTSQVGVVSLRTLFLADFPFSSLQVAILKNRVPFRIRPMLATLTAQPFNKPGWVYDEKYDGDRILAYKEGSRVQLLSRNAEDRTDKFPAPRSHFRSGRRMGSFANPYF